VNITMSRDAEGDGAWGTVFNKLQGITFEVTMKDQSFFVGRIHEADEQSVWFLDEGERQKEVFIEDIEEMEYV